MPWPKNRGLGFLPTLAEFYGLQKWAFYKGFSSLIRCFIDLIGVEAGEVS